MKKLFLLLVAFLLMAACGKTYEDRLRECDEVGEFHDGYALCRQDGKYFYINEKGGQISRSYDSGWNYANGYAIVGKKNDEKWSYHVLNAQGKELDGSYSYVEGNVNMHGNLWVNNGNESHWGAWNVGNAGQWQLVNVETGKVVSDTYQHIDCVTDDGAAVASRRRVTDDNNVFLDYALIDGTGKEILPFCYAGYIGNFHHGLAQFSLRGVLTYSGIDDYEQTKDHKTLFCLETGGLPQPIGYINTKGVVVIPASFAHASIFNESGYARVDYEFSVTNWVERPYLNNYINDKGEVLHGYKMYIAKASFLKDSHWQAGRDDEGKSVVINNKGETIELHTTDPITALFKYVVTRNGREYTMYKVKDGKLVFMFKFEGFGKSDETLYMDRELEYLQIAKNVAFSKDMIYSMHGDYCGESFESRYKYYKFEFE